MRRALSSSGPKIVLYSAHDTTILMLLSALNLTNLKCLQDNFNNAKNSSDTCIIEYPTFASNIVFELWQ